MSQQSAAQATALSRTRPGWHPDLRLTQLLEKKILFFVSHPVCGNLLEQPQWTMIVGYNKYMLNDRLNKSYWMAITFQLSKTCVF